MNILFLAHHKWPHVGGVERHLDAISHKLYALGYSTKTISEEDIKPPHIKFFGLLYIWYWLFKNRSLIARCNLVHIHDVFIWYLPFRFLFPFKKVFITFHGWEGKWPLPMWAIINKKIAYYLTSGNICVGHYIEKYYGVKADYVIHGGVESTANSLPFTVKTKNSLVYLGRQDSDTGINEFKKWLSIQKINYKVIYVSNVKNPEKYLKTAEYCVPSGYLSYLEAKSYGCKMKTFYGNKLKKDYWEEILILKKFDTWEDIANKYIDLWNRK